MACAAWALGNVLVRKFSKNNPVSGETVAFLRPVAGLPVLFLFLLLSPLYPANLQPVFSVNLLNFEFLPYLLVSGTTSSLLTIFLNRTLKVASASYMTMMSMMTPVMVTIVAVLLLGESFMAIQAVGALLIILSGVATHYLKVEKH